MLPKGQFYSRNWILYSALGQPEVDIKSYRLRISGNVENPFSLTYEQLKEKATVEYTSDFHCVTKWSIKDVRWKGVSLRALLEEARPKGDSEWVVFLCLDGYSAPVQLEDALDERAIIAIEMNEKPLRPEQGFPARPFIPHLYGWKSAKWVTEVHVVRSYIDGYWERYGYHERGNVYLEERFKGQEWRKVKKSVAGTLKAQD